MKIGVVSYNHSETHSLYQAVYRGYDYKSEFITIYSRGPTSCKKARKKTFYTESGIGNIMRTMEPRNIQKTCDDLF